MCGVGVPASAITIEGEGRRRLSSCTTRCALSGVLRACSTACESAQKRSRSTLSSRTHAEGGTAGPGSCASRSSCTSRASPATLSVFSKLLPSTVGSRSICRIRRPGRGEGSVHLMVDTEPILQPTYSSTSASSTARCACGWKPLSPTTPSASGWSSGIVPWPEMVVTTGAPRRSASRHTSVLAPEWFTPPPATITGRHASASCAASAAMVSALPRVR